jgi:DNA-binding MarR family transcriptional regulator
MPRPSAKRAELMAAMERATRTISAQNVLLSQAMAEQLGINVSDFECLDLARQSDGEAVTAGRLAAATGLTSGAITGVIDRLEGADLVRRARDPKDRRKVMVCPTLGALKSVPHLFEPLHNAMTAMWSRYSDAELELILDFLTRVREVMLLKGTALREAARLRSGKSVPAKTAAKRRKPASVAAPLDAGASIPKY